MAAAKVPFLKKCKSVLWTKKDMPLLDTYKEALTAYWDAFDAHLRKSKELDKQHRTVFFVTLRPFRTKVDAAGANLSDIEVRIKEWKVSPLYDEEIAEELVQLHLEELAMRKDWYQRVKESWLPWQVFLTEHPLRPGDEKSVKAIYDCKVSKVDYLSFSSGQIIDVLAAGQQWLLGTYIDSSGQVQAGVLSRKHVQNCKQRLP